MDNQQTTLSDTNQTQAADPSHATRVNLLVPDPAVYPTVTSTLLSELVTRLRAAGEPERIVLFGSRARGEAHVLSDLDILIIEESTLPRYRRAPRYLRALVGLFPANDVIVWTPAEIAEWSAVPHAFITTALREGKVLYEHSS